MTMPEIHLNSEIEWKTDGSDPDIYTAALHEIGHVLGVGHSSDRESIMYPWYGRERRILDSELLPALRYFDAIGAEALTFDAAAITRNWCPAPL